MTLEALNAFHKDKIFVSLSGNQCGHQRECFLMKVPFDCTAWQRLRELANHGLTLKDLFFLTYRTHFNELSDV